MKANVCLGDMDSDRLREIADVRKQDRHLPFGLLAQPEVEDAFDVQQPEELVRNEAAVGDLGLAQQLERVPVGRDLLLQRGHLLPEFVPEPGQARRLGIRRVHRAVVG